MEAVKKLDFSDKYRFAGYDSRIIRVNSLKPGGIFFNADLVSSHNQRIYDLSMRHWENHMLKTIPRDEIENRWVPGAKREDHPSPLTDQLSWLAEVGFSGVDVVWKLFGLAVYGGMKPE